MRAQEIEQKEEVTKYQLNEYNNNEQYNEEFEVGHQQMVQENTIDYYAEQEEAGF